MPPEKQWVIYVEGEILGPYPTDLVRKMLQQNRLRLVDFAWGEGLKRWTRVWEIDAFNDLLPPEPKSELRPWAKQDAKSEKTEPRPEPKPEAKPESKPEPKAARRAPEPEPVPQKPPETAPARPVVSKIRQLERVDTEGTLSILGGDHSPYTIINISEGGVFVRSTVAARLPIGTDLRFSMKFPWLQKALEMTGVVIRHSHAGDAAPGFAIEFTRVNPAHKRILQDFVRSHSAQKNP